MEKAIYFDMDGTFVDFYGVSGWLDCLLANDTTPYEIAKPLFNMSLFARYLNRLQRNGWKIGIISWCSKNSTSEFENAVRNAKIGWLQEHLPSVHWDVLNIVSYGDEKYKYGNGVLFDDEEHNRNMWGENAYDVHNILDILKSF